MNIFYFLTFLMNFNILYCKCNPKCYKNKDNNNDNTKNKDDIDDKYNDKDDKDNKDDNKDDNKNIIEKKAFSRWFRNNCGVQNLIIFLIYFFKDNTELLNKFKNSNINFYKKIPIIIDNFNDFLNDNEKTISENDFVDFYIDCIKFFKLKINDSTNNINEYIKNHPEIIDEKGEENDNAYNDEIFQSLHDIRLKYSNILDNLIIINKNKNFFNSLINKYKLETIFIFQVMLYSLKDYFKNKEYWFKYNDVINEMFQIIGKNKNQLNLGTRLFYKNFLEIVFEDFIKISKISDKIYKYNLENKTTTIEFINDDNIDNLTNNDFIKSELIKTNFKNVYFICLNCQYSEGVDHVSCIYKDDNGNWWLNGGFSKIINVDPELIKQQNFKQIMYNYSHIMNYKFIGIRYVLCKSIN